MIMGHEAKWRRCDAFGDAARLLGWRETLRTQEVEGLVRVFEWQCAGYDDRQIGNVATRELFPNIFDEQDRASVLPVQGTEKARSSRSRRPRISFLTSSLPSRAGWIDRLPLFFLFLPLLWPVLMITTDVGSA